MLLLLGFKNYSKNIYLDLSPTFMFWKLKLTLNVIIPHCFFKNNGGKGTGLLHIILSKILELTEIQRKLKGTLCKKMKKM